MDDIPNDNKEVLDAIADQNKLLDGYISTKDTPKIKTVIPATTPEEIETVSKEEFYEAVEELKDNNKVDEVKNIENNKVSQGEEVAEKNKEDKEFLEEKENILKEDYKNITPLEKFIPEEKNIALKKDSSNEYNSKSSTIETNKNNTIKEEKNGSQKNLSSNPEQSVDLTKKELDLKRATENLPEPPSLVKSEKVKEIFNETTENTLKAEDNPPFNLESNKIYNVNVNKTEDKILSNTDDKTPDNLNTTIVENKNKILEETSNINQKTTPDKTVTDKNNFTIPVKPDVEEAKNIAKEQEVFKSNINNNNTEASPQAVPLEINESSAFNKISNNKVTEPETQKPEQTKGEPSVSKNLPKDEFNNQVKPLEVQNASETYLSDLSKNLQNLNNNVLNISNVLNSATNLLATIASKDFGSININEINARGSQQQNKQYSLIGGEIDSYRQSFRTPNEINGVLGRPLAPNIPGVSYV